MRILVVEDERALGAALRRGLSAEGYTVDLAYDGREGLWMARTGEYAAILLDLMLPTLNGYKICQTLRREGITTPKPWTPGPTTSSPSPSPTSCSSHGSAPCCGAAAPGPRPR
jgi:CheY-like chemotaxis protein